MSAFLHHVAGAALPVAVGLVLCAAAARALSDRGPARAYLEPLCIWCLVAVATQVLALGATGDAELNSLILPLAIGAAAALLREERREPEIARAEPENVAPAPAEPVAAAFTPASPEPASSLWADGRAEDQARTGLWSR